MHHKSPQRRYLVRELRFMRGSRRQIIKRCTYYPQAKRAAARTSLGNRHIIVELGAVQLGAWIDGREIQ